jgi:hypothetical protein
MRFSDLDRRMRVFETAYDHLVFPGLFMVARLDGRSFTRLTSERHQFEHPFDERFRDLMLATAEHLMICGFRVLFVHTQSDEISLLFHPKEAAFGRKLRKFNSVLAGGGRASERIERALLLGIGGRRNRAGRSRRSSRPVIGRRQERIALLIRHQLQRPSRVAEAGHRPLVAAARAGGPESGVG